MDLRGFEFYAITGNPVVGASVSVRAASLLHPNPNAIVGTDTTDGNGMWEITGLAEGAYDVEMSITGKTWRHKGMSKLSLSGLYINGQIYTPINWARNGGAELWPNGNGPHTLSTTPDTTHLPPFSITIGSGSTGSLTKETTIVAPGSQASGKVIYTHSSGQFKAEYTVGNAVLWALKGKTLTIQFHAYQGAANQCRVDINDGTTTTSSSRSVTTGSWITMSATAAIATSATAIKFSVIADVSGTFYFDNAILVAGSTVPMYMPNDFEQDQAVLWMGGDLNLTGTVAWGTNQRRTDTAPANLNSITQSGWYWSPNGTTNNPSATDYLVQHIAATSSSIYRQVAFQTGANLAYTRYFDGSSWSSWGTIWHSTIDGSGSGLDADLLDGINAGNSTGQIPVSNGVLCTNLNADQLDSLDSTAFARLAATSNFTTAPTISSNTIWHAGNDGAGSGLDADLLDGINSTGFVRSGANSSQITGVNFLEFTSDGGVVKFSDTAGGTATCQMTAFAGSGYTIYCGAGNQIRFMTGAGVEFFRANNAESAVYFKSSPIWPQKQAKTAKFSAGVGLTTSYVDVSGCSFTADRDGQWVVIAVAEFAVASSDGTPFIKLVAGGVDIEEGVAAGGIAINPATTTVMDIITVSGSTTIKTQTKKASGAGGSTLNYCQMIGWWVAP